MRKATPLYFVRRRSDLRRNQPVRGLDSEKPAFSSIVMSRARRSHLRRKTVEAPAPQSGAGEIGSKNKWALAPAPRTKQGCSRVPHPCRYAF
jgi:hypothetical protein